MPISDKLGPKVASGIAHGTIELNVAKKPSAAKRNGRGSAQRATHGAPQRPNVSSPKVAAKDNMNETSKTASASLIHPINSEAPTARATLASRSNALTQSAA